jgi:hypothetical protein
MKKLLVTALFCLYALAQAQPFPPDQQVSSPIHYIQGNVCGLPSSIAYSEFLMASGAFKGDRCLVVPTGTNGWQLNGAAFSSRIDANRNSYSKAVGGYFSAEVFGTVGGFAESVGIYARTEPATSGVWAVALYGECRARTWGPGTCKGMVVELRGDPSRPPGVPDQQTYIGINVQPGEDQRGVIGMQFQHPQAYAHSIDLAGTCVKVGEVDGVGFYIGFGGRSQLMEFWRGGCRTPGATRHGYVNMNWGTPDVQLNR